MIDAERIIITFGARALAADGNIQVKAHTCGNVASDDDHPRETFII